MFAAIRFQNLFQVLRIGLERSDQPEIEGLPGCGGKEFCQFSWRIYARQPVLPALLGCFNGGLLPFYLLLRRILGIELHNRTAGDDWCNFGCTNLDRFFVRSVPCFSLLGLPVPKRSGIPAAVFLLRVISAIGFPPGQDSQSPQ